MATFCDLVVTRWHAMYRGQRFPCAIGRGGIGTKTGEGDGITPVGTWRLQEIYVRPDRLPGPWQPIRPDMRWCDDPASPFYNSLVRNPPRHISAETLRRPDPLYNAFAVMNFNRDPITPNKGSAIFLHIWRKPRHPTEGCIAFSEPVLRYILTTWTERSRVVVRG